MKWRVLALISLLACLAQADLPYPYSADCLVSKTTLKPDESKRVPTIEIDLDKPPAERWRELVLKEKKTIMEALKTIKEMSFAFFHGSVFHFVDKYISNWYDRFPQPYAEEIKGIADALNVPLGEVVFFNVFYEITASCTGIIVKDKDNEMYHVRNQDFGFLVQWDVEKHQWPITELLRNMMHMVQFKKNGTLLYESISFPGYVGAFSAYKKGKFSLTLNQRTEKNGGLWGLLRWALMLGEQQWTTHLARDTMEKAETFEEAREMLKNPGTKLTSPIYFLLGGPEPNEACLLSMGDSGLRQEKCMQPNEWSLLVTNYDTHMNGTEPFYDARTASGEACVAEMTRDRISWGALYTVLGSRPNFNALTAYSHMMHLKSGFNVAHKRKCRVMEDHCWFA